MVTFRRFTLLFFAFLLVFNLLSIFYCDCHETFFCANLPWFYLGLVLVYLSVSVALAFFPCSGFHFPVICSGKTQEKVVALTFDDGPDENDTGNVLDILKKTGTPASFFLIGRKIAGNETLVTRMQAEGHILGTHSWSHTPFFDFYTSKRMKNELYRSCDEIKRVTGRSPLFFRPPFGVINPMLAGALRKVTLTVVGWNIRSLDTLHRDPARIMQRILGALKPGAIILLHDHTPFTTSHLEQLIRLIDEKGYRIIPLEQLLNTPAYET